MNALEIVVRNMANARALSKASNLSRKERFTWQREYARLMDLSLRVSRRQIAREKASGK